MERSRNPPKPHRVTSSDQGVTACLHSRAKRIKEDLGTGTDCNRNTHGLFSRS